MLHEFLYIVNCKKKEKKEKKGNLVPVLKQDPFVYLLKIFTTGHESTRIYNEHNFFQQNVYNT